MTSVLEVDNHLPLRAVSTDMPSEPGHAGSRQLFGKAALEFGVNLSSQEYGDWRILLDGAHLIDHLLDVEKADILPAISSILDGNFRGDLADDLQLAVYEYMQRQPEDDSRGILDSIRRVGELAEAQRAADRPQTVVQIRREEAEILAGLMSLAPENGGDSVPRQRFNDWLRGWSRSGYLLDTLVDIKKDYENGESGVPPSYSARRVYANAAGTEAVEALRKTPPRLLGKSALLGVKYVFMGIKVRVAADSR